MSLPQDEMQVSSNGYGAFSKIGFSGERPCDRCIFHNRQHLCEDRVPEISKVSVPRQRERRRSIETGKPNLSSTKGEQVFQV